MMSISQRTYQLPAVMKLDSLSKVVKLSREDGLDVFWLEGHDWFHAGNPHLKSLASR